MPLRLCVCTERDALYERWLKAVGRCRKWTGKEDIVSVRKNHKGNYVVMASIYREIYAIYSPYAISHFLCVAKMAVSFSMGVVTGAVLGVALYMALRRQ